MPKHAKTKMKLVFLFFYLMSILLHMKYHVYGILFVYRYHKKVPLDISRGTNWNSEDNSLCLAADYCTSAEGEGVAANEGLLLSFLRTPPMAKYS